VVFKNCTVYLSTGSLLFLNQIIIFLKLRFSSLGSGWPWPDLTILFWPFGFLTRRTFRLFCFRLSGIERVWLCCFRDVSCALGLIFTFASPTFTNYDSLYKQIQILLSKIIMIHLHVLSVLVSAVLSDMISV
jgi:hypothetical protein